MSFSSYQSRLDANFRAVIHKARKEREEREKVLEADEKRKDLEAYSRIRSDILYFFGDAWVEPTLDGHFGYVETD